MLPIITALAMLSSTALASDIYINGERVRGITNLTLDNCQVTFNARGDVYITAPGFKVLPTPAKGALVSEELAAPTLLKNRYFLFTQTSESGKVPYAFEVWVNGKLAKKFTSSQEQVAEEITLLLKKGKNEIEVKALYQAGAGGTAADTYSILVGRGRPNEGSLEINEVLLSYTCKGSDVGDSTEVFTVDAK